MSNLSPSEEGVQLFHGAIDGEGGGFLTGLKLLERLRNSVAMDDPP